MLKKLNANGFVNYEKYKGVSLTKKGEQLAVQIIRKHRLWETFLVDKLKFSWDEVHELAEELEHIDSEELVNRIEEFLDYPEFDPHGDPIPDRHGKIHRREQVALSELKKGDTGLVTGVRDSSKEFLQYLDTVGIQLGQTIEVIQILPYDESRKVLIHKSEVQFSLQVSKNLFVTIQ